MECEPDDDDPPPEETWLDNYWYAMNRLAEFAMYQLRLLGFI